MKLTSAHWGVEDGLNPGVEGSECIRGQMSLYGRIFSDVHPQIRIHTMILDSKGGWLLDLRQKIENHEKCFQKKSIEIYEIETKRRWINLFFWELPIEYTEVRCQSTMCANRLELDKKRFDVKFRPQAFLCSEFSIEPDENTSTRTARCNILLFYTHMRGLRSSGLKNEKTPGERRIRKTFWNSSTVLERLGGIENRTVGC